MKAKLGRLVKKDEYDDWTMLTTEPSRRMTSYVEIVPIVYFEVEQGE